MTVREALLHCPTCLAGIVVPEKDADTDGRFWIPKHSYGTRDSVTGRDGWICAQPKIKVSAVAGRSYETPA